MPDTFDTLVFTGPDWTSVFKVSSSESCGSVSKYVDFPHIMALMKTKVLTGKGYTFDTTNQDLQSFWDKLEEGSRFQEKLGIIAYQTFKYGRCLVGYDQLEDGEWKIFATDNSYRPFVTKAYDEIIGVWFLKQVFISDTSQLLIREGWNNKQVTRSYYFNPDQPVPTGSVPTQIPSQYRLPTKEPNRFAPLLPFHDFHNYEFSSQPDWQASRSYILNKFNPLMEFYAREMKVNRSRVVFSTTSRNAKTLMKDLKSKEGVPFFINVENNNPENNSVPVEKVDSNLKIAELEEAIKSSIITIFSLSGMSISLDASGGGAEVTATEISTNTSDRTNTIIMSRTSINANMKIFLTKLFQSAGFNQPDFTFELKENTAISEKDLLETVLRRLDSQLLSRAEAISLLDNITIKDAEEKVKEIDKSNENNLNMYNSILNNSVNSPQGQQQNQMASELASFNNKSASQLNKEVEKENAS